MSKQALALFPIALEAINIESLAFNLRVQRHRGAVIGLGDRALEGKVRVPMGWHTCTFAPRVIALQNRMRLTQSPRRAARTFELNRTPCDLQAVEATIILIQRDKLKGLLHRKPVGTCRQHLSGVHWDPTPKCRAGCPWQQRCCRLLSAWD